MNIKTLIAENDADITRIQECLLFMLRHPGVKNNNWRVAVVDEARTLGYRLETPASIGCNCRPDIDRGILYGGDMEDVF